MRLRFFTDPHLGLNRSTHTIPSSRQALRWELSDQAAVMTSQEQDKLICLGDLFDTFSVDNQTMLDGAILIRSCDLILTGNHDSSNRDGAMSSLSALLHLLGAPWWQDTVGHLEVSGGHRVVWVNHQLTQGAFDDLLVEHQFLRTAISEAGDKEAILLLHCNYDSPFAQDDASLNLSKEQAAKLLERFKYILIGHEHNARSDFDGRLQILGNIHPTSFSDISDKYCWTMEVNGSGFCAPEPELIWSKAERYLEVNVAALATLTDLGDAQFVSVVGTANAGDMPRIAKQVADLWKLSDELLMVRNIVVDISAPIKVEEESIRLQDVPAKITHALAGTILEPVWKEYLERHNGQ